MEIVLNWKMNLLENQARPILELLSSQPQFQKNTVVLAPAWLWPLMGQYSVAWGVQNLYPQDWGAFTGELSLVAAQVYGATWALVGHSERRLLLAESDAFIEWKLRFALSKGVNVILAVGETLAQRQAGATSEILEQQLAVLDRVLRPLESHPEWVPVTESTLRQKVWVAYEPVWAIGTGLSATAEVIQSTLSPQVRRWPVAGWLYGGSVSEESIASIAQIPEVSGVLVGSASLKPEKVQALWEGWLKARR